MLLMVQLMAQLCQLQASSWLVIDTQASKGAV
jgi:hypothetical protein